MMDNIIEKWKPIPGYPGYFASDQGRIKREAAPDRRGHVHRGYILAPLRIDAKKTAPDCKSTGQWFRVVKDGRAARVAGADLVALAWLGGFDPAVHRVGFRSRTATDIRAENLFFKSKEIMNLQRRLDRRMRENFERQQ